MRLPIFFIDAFADRPFAGNPAAVCPLAAWLPDAQMQSIAAEMNLSETAFFAPRGETFEIRWFTPSVEVDLCGHATLASAFVVTRFLEPTREAMIFHSRSGPLGVAREGEQLVLDFPSQPPHPVEMPAGLADGLGAVPEAVLLSRIHHLALFADERAVRELAPDVAALGALGLNVVATAPGQACDFVSRFFAPALGIAEDPVTGATHCALIPYWSGRLGRTRLAARQVSRRGGALSCTLKGDRVAIGGTAVCTLRGEIAL